MSHTFGFNAGAIAQVDQIVTEVRRSVALQQQVAALALASSARSDAVGFERRQALGRVASRPPSDSSGSDSGGSDGGSRRFTSSEGWGAAAVSTYPIGQFVSPIPQRQRKAGGPLARAASRFGTALSQYSTLVPEDVDIPRHREELAYLPGAGTAAADTAGGDGADEDIYSGLLDAVHRRQAESLQQRLRPYDYRYAPPPAEADRVSRKAEMALTADHAAARDRLNSRFPSLRLADPIATFIGADRKQPHELPDPRSDEQRYVPFQVAAPPRVLASSSHADGYSQCLQCGLLAPDWHRCPAAVAASSRSDPRTSALTRGNASDINPPQTFVYRDPAAEALATTTRETNGARRPQAVAIDWAAASPSRSAMPHAVEPLTMQTWGMRDRSRSPVANPISDFGGFDGRVALPSPQRPGFRRAQRVLDRIAAIRSDPSLLADPALQPSVPREKSPARRDRRPSPDSELPRRPAALSQAAGTSPPTAGTSSPNIASGRTCVWCGRPKPKEHDLACSQRRVMCRRCQTQIRAADQDDHRQVCPNRKR
jgi:hypothetical protein